MNDLTMAGRRSDPNYSQVYAYIPKELVIEFKVALARNELSMAEALEQAVRLWLERMEKGLPLPEVQERVDQRRRSEEEDSK